MRHPVPSRGTPLALPFREVWLVDFEFVAEPGERPVPVCLVARELRSGREMRLWRDQFGPTTPYPTGPDALLLAYSATAWMGWRLALGGPVPEGVDGLPRSGGVGSEHHAAARMSIP